jgi:hypothetical protein
MRPPESRRRPDNLAARAEIEGVARRIEKVETAIEPAFQRRFVAAMAFPNKEDAFPKHAKRVELLARKEAGGEGGRRRCDQRAPTDIVRWAIIDYGLRSGSCSNWRRRFASHIAPPAFLFRVDRFAGQRHGP